MHDMPRLRALQHVNGSDYYPNATKPQAVDLRLAILWSQLVSNQRPSACEADALPLSYGTEIVFERGRSGRSNEMEP